LQATLELLEEFGLTIGPKTGFAFLLCPFICPLSDEEEISAVDKLMPANSGTRVSGADTPAVAPAAFLAPNIAIGSADLLIK